MTRPRKYRLKAPDKSPTSCTVSAPSLDVPTLIPNSGRPTLPSYATSKIAKLSCGRAAMRKSMHMSGSADVSRRDFLARGAVASVGAVAIGGTGAHEAAAQNGNGIKWDYTADVVVIGAGVAGLPAAITARDNGASVIIVDENFDIGGRGILSGGRVQIGGGHALQQKLGIKDTPDMIFNDWVRFDHSESRYSDRDLIRVFADENVPTYDFLIENGVEFIEKP